MENIPKEISVEKLPILKYKIYFYAHTKPVKVGIPKATPTQRMDKKFFYLIDIYLVIAVKILCLCPNYLDIESQESFCLVTSI